MRHTPTPVSPLNEPSKIDEYTENVTQTIHSAIAHSSIDIPNSRRLPFTPRGFQKLIEEKRETWKKWQTTRDPALKRKLNHLIETMRLGLLKSSAASTQPQTTPPPCTDYVVK